MERKVDLTVLTEVLKPGGDRDVPPVLHFNTKTCFYKTEKTLLKIEDHFWVLAMRSPKPWLP
jgi:hypothetical protein